MAGDADEIERLVVTLIAESSQFITDVDAAESAMIETARRITREAEEASRAHGHAMQEAAAIIAATRTPTEQYTYTLNKLNEHYAAGRIDLDTYNRALEASRSQLPENVAAAERYNAAMQDGARVTMMVATASERFQDESLRLSSLLSEGAITQDTYTRAIARAEKEMEDANEEMQAAKRITSSVKNDTERYAEAIKELEGHLKAGRISQDTFNRAAKRAEEAQEDVADAIRESKQWYDNTRTAGERYAAELAKLNRLHEAGRVDVDTYRRAVKQLRTDLRATGATVRDVSGHFQSMGSGVSQIGQRITMGVTLPVLAAAAASVKAGADIDSAFAGLRKTVDGTPEELAAIKTEMEGLVFSGTPFELTELLDIGAEAGQLGIDTSNIVDFTKTIADLRVTTNLGDEAATTFARIANISGLAESQFSNLGSTIVALGNTTATTEREIGDMMLRLSGAGRQIGLNVAEIAALSAGLSSVGIEAEAGGTAFSQLFMRLASAAALGGEELDNFADIAGMSSAEFKAAFQEDAAGAIVTLLKELKALEGSDAIIALDTMGIEGVRLQDAMLRTASAVDVLEGAFVTANTAFEENTALAKEAEVRYGSFASQVSNLWAQLQILGSDIHEVLAPYILYAVDAVKEGVAWFRSLSDEMKFAIMIVAGIAAMVGPITIVVGAVVAGIAGIVSFVVAIGPAIPIIAAIVAGLVSWLVQMALIYGAAAALVYYIAGPEGIASAWTTATEYASTFFTSVVGFLSNFQTNAGIAIDWFKTNWQSLVFDGIELFKTFVVNMVENTVVVLHTVVRLWVAWQGWLSGMFMRLFTVDFVNAVIEGVKFAAQVLWQFATAQADIIARILTGQEVDMTGFFTQLDEDFRKGADNINFAETARGIIQDGFADLKNPLEGAALQTDAPQFVYDMGTEVGEQFTEGAADAIEAGADTVADAGDAVVSELQEALDGLEGKLQESIDTYGMSSREIDLWKLKTEGATDAQLANARALSEQLDAWDAWKDKVAEGSALVEQFKTPGEKYADTMAMLQDHLNAGTIDLDTFTRAAMDARKTIEGGIEADVSIKGVEGFEEDSAAAAEAWAVFQAGLGAPGSAMAEEAAVRQAGLDAMLEHRFALDAVAAPTVPGVTPAGRSELVGIPANGGSGPTAEYDKEMVALLGQLVEQTKTEPGTRGGVLKPAQLAGG